MMHIKNRLISLAALTPLALLGSASPAWAHAFGIRYDLPLPLWLYLGGAGAAVGLSFAVITLFIKSRQSRVEDLGFNLAALPVLGWLSSGAVLNLVRLLSLASFIFLLTAGFLGHPDPFRNFVPTFIWVVWWVGMAFASTLIGNLWDLINPWKIAYTWVDKIWGGFGAGHDYPRRLGRWPAVLLFLIFVWMELISEQAEQPRMLALLIVAYSAITWTGMRYYGRDTWLANGEVFAVVFTLLARFACLHGANGEWRLRLPAVGLLSRDPVPLSGVCFVLLLLTSVTFDGILETPLWVAFLEWISESQVLRPGLLALRESGVDLLSVIKSAALIVLPLCFIAAFLLTAHAIARMGGGTVTTRDVAGYFVLSLVPIAIAYHLSHYLSYLLIAGQNIIPLASDPFGIGWDLFGTIAYNVDIGIVNAKMIWYVAVTAIVVGHVLAVYIAHVMAARIFPGRAQALASQLPMLILMVAYTMISLWILSQPIIA
ncbi:MAG: hypothetical protein HN478_02855 [Rhodospirillaceae bacterium]|nr:hypothetical protein [Rhodospirillaceae bacterium]MBT5191817.1 hypothetical protein [Rhodospirillaceae bacterium]MBT5896126.1 hypothetical protein [Rhodospirillaceae bacterium]